MLGLREWGVSIVLGLSLLVTGCGPGSGRYTGTDVAVTGVGPAAPVFGGESAAFVMTVTNVGGYAAANVGISNLIGNQLALTGISCVASEGATCPTTGVTMTVPSLPAGASLTFQVNAVAVQGANGIISNTMSASFTDDNDRVNNTVTVSGTAVSNNLNVTASAPAGPIAGGASTLFTMKVANSGPGAATDVDLSTVLGANLAPAGAIDCAPDGGAVAPVAMPDGTLRSASIPMSGTLTCSVPVTIAAGTNGPVSATMTVQAAGDERAGDNSATASVLAVSSDLGVSQTAPSEVGAGATAVFTAVVANPGPGAASDLTIAWTHNSAAGLTFEVPTCSASLGAKCPVPLGPTMTLPSLAAGRSLTFRFSVATTPGYRGPIVNALSVASSEDVDPGNNSVSTTVQVVDPRNGAYTVFAADGRQYGLQIDFDSGQYTMSGNGQTKQFGFTLDPATGDYVVKGNARLRATQDMLVGGNEFEDGVLPYVAARSFATSLASAAGSYNLATRNVSAAGVASTHAGTAVLSGNTLSVCQSDALQVVPVRNCAPSSRKDYLNVSLAGSVFIGTTAGGEAYAFSVAQTGGAKLLVSAGLAPDGTRQLRTGMIDSAAGITSGPPVRGPSTTGDWVTITLGSASSPPTYTATGSTTADSANLSGVNGSGGGPFSMLTGASTTYAANIYLMQGSPLIIVFGAYSATNGTASGLLQMGLP